MAPVALGLLGGGGGNSPAGAPPEGVTRGVDRSSGAPIWRGPASETGGGGSFAAVLVPSWRGAPGAFGLAEGSNASPRRPLGGGLSTGVVMICDVTTGAPVEFGALAACGY